MMCLSPPVAAAWASISEVIFVREERFSLVLNQIRSEVQIIRSLVVDTFEAGRPCRHAPISFGHACFPSPWSSEFYSSCDLFEPYRLAFLVWNTFGTKRVSLS